MSNTVKIQPNPTCMAPVAQLADLVAIRPDFALSNSAIAHPDFTLRIWSTTHPDLTFKRKSLVKPLKLNVTKLLQTARQLLQKRNK